MNSEDDALNAKMDRLLRAWADDCSAEARGEAELIRTIVAATAPRRLAIASARRPGSALALSAAAVILVATLATLTLLPQRNQQAAVPLTVVTSRAGLSELWSGTAAVFGPQLNWLCDLDGELLLGIETEAGAMPTPKRAYVLLMVRERDLQSANWSAVWTGRVVCPLGEAIDFASNQSHSGGSIWVQSRPDGRLVTNHWLTWPDHPEISGSVESEVSPGESRVVAERIVDGRSLQVVQQIWVPPAG